MSIKQEKRLTRLTIRSANESPFLQRINQTLKTIAAERPELFEARNSADIHTAVTANCAIASILINALDDKQTVIELPNTTPSVIIPDRSVEIADKEPDTPIPTIDDADERPAVGVCKFQSRHFSH